MTLDFTAIDFETANSFRGSPCAVGLVKVRDGMVVDSYSTLIQPPRNYGHFDPFNVAIHGITAEMVNGAPQWSEVLPLITDFIGTDITVAHNVGFDSSVIRFASDAENLLWPELRLLCSLVLARNAINLPSNSLPFVA